MTTNSINVNLARQTGTGKFVGDTSPTIANPIVSTADGNISFPSGSGVVQIQTKPVISAPGNSASSSLALGSSFQNTTGNDILLTVYLSVTAATAASILLGVGSASNPTQQTIVSGLSLLALSLIAVPIYIPNNYFALLSTSGVITRTISGQISMPV